MIPTLYRRAALALAAALLAAAPAARAAQLVVTSLADTPVAGACTLREAMAAAAANADVGGCVCSGAYGDDRIGFAISGTLTLGATLQAGAGRLVIDGSGQRVTISGNRAWRVLQILDSARLELRRLTIADGVNTALLAQSNSELTIADSTFVGHQAAASGSVLWHMGSLPPQGRLDIRNSSFVGNGGGNVVVVYGNPDMPILLEHNTFTGNAASGGVLSQFSGALRNNLLAGNGGPNCGPANFSDAGGNLDDGASCRFNAPTSQSATPAGLDPAGLADHGGATLTVARCRATVDPFGCPGASQAIDAANGCPLGADQRGVARPQDGNAGGIAGCDIGAYEVAPTWPFRGLLAPIDNAPVVNAMKAGAAAPVKFSLGGNRGLAIFAGGYPQAQFTACTGGMADAVEQTLAAGASSLQYDAASDIYACVWKTDKAWSGRCATLVLRFIDGSEHAALFQFK